MAAFPEFGANSIQSVHAECGDEVSSILCYCGSK